MGIIRIEDSPRLGSGSRKNASEVALLTIRGARLIQLDGSISGKGHTLYEVELPPKYDARCEIEIAIKGSIRGKVIAEIGGEHLTNPACAASAGVSGKLWASLSPEKAMLEIASSAQSLAGNGFLNGRQQPNFDFTGSPANGPQERTSVYAYGPELRETNHARLMVTAEANGAEYITGAANGYTIAQLVLRHEVLISGYYTFGDKRECAFEWNSTTGYIYQTEEDRVFTERIKAQMKQHFENQMIGNPAYPRQPRAKHFLGNEVVDDAIDREIARRNAERQMITQQKTRVNRLQFLDFIEELSIRDLKEELARREASPEEYSLELKQLQKGFAIRRTRLQQEIQAAEEIGKKYGS